MHQQKFALTRTFVMNRLLPIVCLALGISACEPKGHTASVPQFAQPEHVRRCLPALYALDELAAAASGSQIGQRIPAAPWLRINRYDKYLIETRALTDTTLGAVLLPMQYNALAGLRIERHGIAPATIQQWQQQYRIDNIDHFIGYCSGEAAFAQLRDSKPTISWLEHVATSQIDANATLPEHTGTPPSPSTGQTWRSYTLASMPQGSTGYAKNTLGLPLLGPATEQELLRRYAPTYSVATEHKPQALAWAGQRLATNGINTAYGFVDTAFWRGITLFRLHYVAWFARPHGSAKDNAFVYRLSILPSGKALAVETMRLNGGDYRLYLDKQRKLDHAPTDVIALNTAIAPKMAIQLSGSPLTITEVARLSGGHNLDTYALARFDSVYTLATDQGQRSVFGPNNTLATPGLCCLAAINALFGGSAPAANIGHHRISRHAALYFDDPALFDKLGLVTTR